MMYLSYSERGALVFRERGGFSAPPVNVGSAGTGDRSKHGGQTGGGGHAWRQTDKQADCKVALVRWNGEAQTGGKGQGLVGFLSGCGQERRGSSGERCSRQENSSSV